MSVLLSVAVRNLLQSRRRSTLLALAIGLVTMMLVLLLGISGGIKANMIRSATTISSGYVNVAGFFKVNTTDVAPMVTNVTEIRKIVEENTDDLVQVMDRGRGWCKVTSGTASVQAGLSGVDINEETRLLDVLQLAPTADYKKEGGTTETPGNLKDLLKPNSAVIFASQAKRLGVEVGDELTFQTETSAGRTNTIDVTIVAVVRDMGLLSSWSMFVPKQVTRDLYQLNEDTSGAVWLYLKDIDQSEAVMDHLREVFKAKGYRVMDHEAKPFFMKFETAAGEDWTGQALDLTVWSDEVSFLSWVITAFDTVTWFLITILVVIIAVGIMNAMWNAVRERTREVGTLRAIGMYRTQVLQMFLLEAVVLGLFSTSMGAIVGALLSLVLNAANIRLPMDAMKAILLSDTLYLSVSPASLISAVLALTAFTTLSALWPAIRAASLQPVVALSHAD